MASSYYASAFLLSATLTNALTPYAPNCTAPPADVTFVFSPPVRGTMDIIWSCFTVLLTCTWSIQHLSVPYHVKAKKKEKPQKQKKHRFWSSAFTDSPWKKTGNKRFQNSIFVEKVNIWWKSPGMRAFMEKVSFNITKLEWMAFSLLGPEYILGKALTELLAAQDSRRDFQREGCDGWTTTHGFFANMRGFVLRFDVAAVPTPLEPSKQSEKGRALHQPNPDGDPPYLPQNAEKAEEIELEHCHRYCHIPCENRDYSAADKDGPLSPTPPKSKAAERAKQAYDTDNRESNAQARKQSGGLLVQTNHKPITLRDSVDLSPENFSAQTLINSPDFPTPHTANTTSRTLTNGQEISNPTPTKTSSSPLALPPRSSSSTRPPPRRTTIPQPPSIVSSQDAVPFASEKETLHPHVPWRGTWALSARQLLYAYRSGLIAGPPFLSAEDLSDRSKSDTLVNTAAVVQIIWLVVQISARAFQHLAVTLLEITVLATAGCAVATYILLWHKPQDVMTPTYIEASTLLTREHVIQLAARAPVSTLMVKEFWIHGVAIHVMADNVFPTTRGLPLRLPFSTKESILLNPIILGFGGGGSLYGALHLAAWNFVFPTAVEQLLWRISCLMLVVCPLVATAGYFLTLNVTQRSKMADVLADKVLRPGFRVFVSLYLAARLFLLVEVFRSLAYAPPSTWLEVEWPSMIPHGN
ncbi:hypothetical protein MMC19_007003 [Ptychographa xylographoides]|nr:hypothetical protein [Ptychographa xylographoides]